MVTPKSISLSIIGNEDIGPTVAVEVSAEGTHTPPFCSDSGLTRNICKSTIAVVSIENVRLPVEVTGHTVPSSTSLGIATEWSTLGIKREVISDEQIKISIAIIVEERRA